MRIYFGRGGGGWITVCMDWQDILIYSKIPLSDHSPGATMPLLRPLSYSPDFSPMLSTVKLFYSATIPLFQFATTDFSPKPHIFPILRPHRRRTRPHRQSRNGVRCVSDYTGQSTHDTRCQFVSIMRLIE